MSHITPVNVEFFEAGLLCPRWRLLILNEFHLVLVFTYISDNIVLAVADINYKLLSPTLILLFPPSALCYGGASVNIEYQVAPGVILLLFNYTILVSSSLSITCLFILFIFLLLQGSILWFFRIRQLSDIPLN